MTRLNLILTLLLAACFTAHAAEGIKSVNGVAKANIKSIGGIAEANIKALGPVDNTAAGGSFILEEKCDGTGKPSAAWTDINTVDWDYATSPAPLEGTQSLYIDGQSGGARAQFDFTPAVSEIWVRFKFRASVISGPHRIVSFRNQTGDSEVGYLEMTSGSVLRIVQGAGGAGSAGSTVDTLAPDTTYNIWVRFKIGGGANGEGTVGFSATTTEPTVGNAFASFASGTATTQVNRLQFRNSNTSGGNYFMFDWMTADDAAIGNF